MKILLLLKQAHFIRPFVGTVGNLAGRGHEIRVLWHRDHEGASAAAPELDGVAGVSCGFVPGRRSEARREVAVARRAWNYLRYLDRPYRGASKLRKRAFDKVLRLVLEDRSPADPAWGETGLALTPREVRRLLDFFAFVEDLIPTDPACDAVLAEERPDVLLISPLVDLNSSTQADFVKSAKKMGIPVGLLVYSWDNLSTKGGLHVMPDRVFVWNRRQRGEAVQLHGAPRDRVVITGAPKFDPFIACTPRVDRAAFCEALGFDPAMPILTYLCSSEFVSGNEFPFVAQWLAAIRSAPDTRVRGANLLVRPHPDRALISLDVPATKVQWPPDVTGAVRRPFDDPRAVVFNTTSVTPQGLYECLWHSTAIVGLNTSAEIEAGILGRPVFTVRAGEDTADGQQTTLHFHYLLKREGGFVEEAATLEEHTGQLAPVVQPGWKGQKALVRAVRGFVRPAGWNTPVAQVLADAIERELFPLARPAMPAAAGAAR